MAASSTCLVRGSGILRPATTRLLRWVDRAGQIEQGAGALYQQNRV